MNNYTWKDIWLRMNLASVFHVFKNFCPNLFQGNGDSRGLQGHQLALMTFNDPEFSKQSYLVGTMIPMENLRTVSLEYRQLCHTKYFKGGVSMLVAGF